MTAFSRLDSSLLGRWWWTVDRWTITALIALAAAGAILTLAASPPVAERLNLDTFYFARRQLLVLPVAIGVMLAVSLLNRDGVRRLALFMFTMSIVLTALTLVDGAEIKGATRWIKLRGTLCSAVRVCETSLRCDRCLDVRGLAFKREVSRLPRRRRTLRQRGCFAACSARRGDDRPRLSCLGDPIFSGGSSHGSGYGHRRTVYRWWLRCIF